jgi:hypothetical protein
LWAKNSSLVASKILVVSETAIRRRGAGSMPTQSVVGRARESDRPVATPISAYVRGFRCRWSSLRSAR